MVSVAQLSTTNEYVWCAGHIKWLDAAKRGISEYKPQRVAAVKNNVTLPRFWKITWEPVASARFKLQLQPYHG